MSPYGLQVALVSEPEPWHCIGNRYNPMSRPADLVQGTLDALILSIVVLGGLGSNIGAFWGGLVIGIVQQMSTLVLPYQLQNTAIFIVFLLIIFLRPQGMFGRLTERT